MLPPNVQQVYDAWGYAGAHRGNQQSIQDAYGKLSQDAQLAAMDDASRQAHLAQRLRDLDAMIHVDYPRYKTDQTDQAMVNKIGAAVAEAAAIVHYQQNGPAKAAAPAAVAPTTAAAPVALAVTSTASGGRPPSTLSSKDYDDFKKAFAGYKQSSGDKDAKGDEHSFQTQAELKKFLAANPNIKQKFDAIKPPPTPPLKMFVVSGPPQSLTAFNDYLGKNHPNLTGALKAAAPAAPSAPIAAAPATPTAPDMFRVNGSKGSVKFDQSMDKIRESFKVFCDHHQTGPMKWHVDDHGVFTSTLPANLHKQFADEMRKGQDAPLRLVKPLSASTPVAGVRAAHGIAAQPTSPSGPTAVAGAAVTAPPQTPLSTRLTPRGSGSS